MHVILNFSPVSTPPVLDAKAIGEAIFDEWYPTGATATPYRWIR